MLASLDTAEMWNRLEVIWSGGNWVSYGIFRGLRGNLVLFRSVAENPSLTESGVLDLWLVVTYEGLMITTPGICIHS